MLRTLCAVLTIVVLLSAACDGEDAAPTPTAISPTATEAPAPPSPPPDDSPTPTSGDGLPAIVIEQPELGAIVQVPFAISGTANVFEAALSVQVVTAEGALVCQHNLTATSGSGTRGDWAAMMAFPPPEPPPGNAAVPMVVRALSYSAQDGSEENVVTVEVNVSGERPPNVIESPACGARVPVAAPLVVSGITDAFEGVLQLELRDSSGTAVVSQPVQAASGTRNAPWTASLSLAGVNAGAYMLIAFDYSAQDGSRQNEFAIPIELMAP